MPTAEKRSRGKTVEILGVDRSGAGLADAERISRELKNMAREARRPTQAWLGVFKDSRGRPMKPFGIGIILSFFGAVLLPIAAAALYLAVFASDQYSTEVRFAVRGGEQNLAMDPISMLTGSASQMRLQDAAIVADYIQSRGLVELLNERLNLRQKFSNQSGGKADWLFGFNPSRSTERLVKFWWWQVDVSTDRMSGIITVLVRAFTPQDSQAIAQAIIYASEALVNELSERSRADALRLAQNELVIAERILQDKIRQMRDLRDKERVLDPTQSTEAFTKMIGEMRLELVRMESEYEAQKTTVSESAPQLRVLEARIRAAREQIRLIEQKMTSTTGSKDSTLAESISSFDRLKLEQDFAQKQYVAAAAALERARLEVESKQVYLTTFLQPGLAEEALYPKRWWILSAITILCLVLWGAGVGLAILVRDHAA